MAGKHLLRAEVFPIKFFKANIFSPSVVGAHQRPRTF